MAPFPTPATHWHVSAPRRDSARRYSRADALTALRLILAADHAVIRDPGFVAALAVLDAGWTSARVGPHQYVAYACACPELPVR
ncbi:hypothetical protein GCM10027589_13830 [Actinocorallia lasiicapitis]